MGRFLRSLGYAVVVLVIAAAAVFVWLIWWPEIDPIVQPGAETFDQQEIERGRVLAAAGACEVCHTSERGEAFAGGRGIATPFGTIHSTNITPDPETGIGSWSLEAFRRSMREGVDRSGNHLYPAFPFTHFTKVTDDDIAAIYAFLMTRNPVEAESPGDDLSFPASFRPLLAGWKLLYHETGAFEPDPDQSETWNRGAYLVEGLGHCSACHSPRDALGGIPEGEEFAGGMAEGWLSFALDETSPAPVPWSDIALVNYMLDGWDLDHGVVAGPMQPVVDHFRQLSEDDAFAVAEYLLSLQGEAAEGARDEAIAFAEERAFGGGGEARAEQFEDALARGAATFREICMNCHRAASDTVPLALTSTVNAPDPSNVIHITLDGVDAPGGSPGKSMPGFGATLDNEEVEDLLSFLRVQFTDKEPWQNLGARIEEIRASGD